MITEAYADVMFCDGPLKGETKWLSMQHVECLGTYTVLAKSDYLTYHISCGAKIGETGQPYYWYFATLIKPWTANPNQQLALNKYCQDSFKPSIIHDFDLWFWMTRDRIVREKAEHARRMKEIAANFKYTPYLCIEPRNIMRGLTA
jgi:hypothetical protein